MSVSDLFMISKSTFKLLAPYAGDKSGVDEKRKSGVEHQG
jgi:hypothetical protein